MREATTPATTRLRLLVPILWTSVSACALLLTGCQSRTDPSRPPERDMVGLEHTDATGGGKALFYRGIAGDRDALEQATARYEQAHARDPQDAVARAYLGACRLLQSRDAFFLWDKARLAREGLTLMNDAVASAPQDVEVRFLRGITYQNLPSFFGVGATAAEDLSFAAGHAAQAVTDGKLPPQLGAAALYHHGLLRTRAGDREGGYAAWRQAIALAPHSPASRAAAKELAATEGAAP